MANTIYHQYLAGTLDPKIYEALLGAKREFEKHKSVQQALAERAHREKWGILRLYQERQKALSPLYEKYQSQLAQLLGDRNLADAITAQWANEATAVKAGGVDYSGMGWGYRPVSNLSVSNDITAKAAEIAKLSIQPKNFQEYSQTKQLQQEIEALKQQLTRSKQEPTATVQPTPAPSPQSVGDNWELPEEGLLQTGEFATQLAKQRQQQDANLMASGLTRQQILQQRGSENVVRELGLSKMIAEQRRKSIQEWLQTVGGLQQQTRPPDFTGLKEMALALQQGTSAQQQMMMKVFENLMKQGGS